MISIFKVYDINKNPKKPTIELNDNGLTLINKKSGNQFCTYDDISFMKMNSKALNGYLKLKSTKKKVIIDYVALDLLDQKEIVMYISKKIK